MSKLNSECLSCWGSGWETQFITPCKVCGGSGKQEAQPDGTYAQGNTDNEKLDLLYSSSTPLACLVQVYAHLQHQAAGNTTVALYTDRIRARLRNDISTFTSIGAESVQNWCEEKVLKLRIS